MAQSEKPCAQIETFFGLHLHLAGRYHKIPKVPGPRGAESQGWARGQLKYYASLVLCSPKQARKMAQFSPDFDVIPPQKKRSSVFHKLICQCHFDGPYEAHWVLLWASSSPWAP